MLPSFLTQAAGTLLADKASNIFGEIFGGDFLFDGRGRTEQGQGTAVERSTTSIPQETQASGTSGAEAVSQPIFAPRIDIGTAGSGMAGGPMTAGAGALIPLGGNLLSKLGPKIIGGLGLGAAGAIAPMVLDQFGQPKKLRVTKKLKAQVRQAVNLMGIEATAQAMGVDVNTIIFILMKKMRNDGPYVTKAAVRKTRQTVRKMKTLCDLYDDLRPAAKRRPPMRKAATTRITQVK